MIARILIVDDDLVSRELLSEVLTKEGYSVELAESAEQALEVLQKKIIPIVISDIRMLELSGLDLLKSVKKKWPETVVILMTGFGSVEGAMSAIREGAFDYISKPFQIAELRTLVRRAVKQSQAVSGSAEGEAPSIDASREKAAHLIGKSPKIVDVYKLCARAALSKSYVLILGETGTGKTFVARTIHENSALSALPLKRLGAELTDDAWIKELSGIRDGALMIEEISNLSQPKQAALSQFLDTRERDRAQFRLYSLSQQTLKALQQEANLKSDLFYRLSTVTIEIPPLRDRKEDLAELTQFYLVKASQLNERRLSRLSPESTALFEGYAWPGNLRELEQTLERAIALASSEILEPEDFPSLSGQSSAPASSPSSGDAALPRENGISPSSSLESMEREHIQRVLEEFNFNKTKAAETLGIDRATLYRKCKAYGINLKDAKG